MQQKAATYLRGHSTCTSATHAYQFRHS